MGGYRLDRFTVTCWQKTDSGHRMPKSRVAGIFSGEVMRKDTHRDFHFFLGHEHLIFMTKNETNV